MSASTWPRVPDWPERLALVIDRARGLPFVWGVCDCAVFAASAVKALTDIDALGPMRGGWSTAETAREFLRRRGGLVPAVTRALGRPMRRVAGAQRGDILLILGDRGHGLAVCDGARWVAPGARGLVRGPLLQALRVWPVGHEIAEGAGHA
jgi:hypothetical protein